MDLTCEEPHFDITINENEIIDGAKEIVTKIRPSWPLDKLHFKVTAIFRRHNFKV